MLPYLREDENEAPPPPPSPARMRAVAIVDNLGNFQGLLDPGAHCLFFSVCSGPGDTQVRSGKVGREGRT
ncbi:hypothetical protein TrRE_jg543 [Triparma retinervis]|uniref:Uncharacterized protein n=1 Tax=Triparma retinervis TaxID=2557542 RepID=A0A9W7DPD6_9STRA|nr:hypothetical protein TrRE_jg543 [Triparma retinervis]